MTNRNQFKKVSIKDQTYLYPLPILRENKYLLQIESEWSDFLIFCLEKRLIDSPDLKSELYQNSRIHEDGRTPIIIINPNHKIYAVLRDNDLQSLIHLLNNNEDPLSQFQKLIGK